MVRMELHDLIARKELVSVVSWSLSMGGGGGRSCDVRRSESIEPEGQK
jgi:hypothetical protein